MTVKVTGIQLSECWWGNYFAWPYRIALKCGLGCRERGGGGGANLRLCYMSYAIIKHEVESRWSIQILYSGKLSRIGENTIFCGENFSRLVAFVAPKDTMPQNFVEKTFAKPWNSRKFFPSKVSCYTVLCSHFEWQEINTMIQFASSHCYWSRQISGLFSLHQAMG